MEVTWRAIPYRIGLRRPVATAHGTMRARRGWWLVATDDEGRIGLGEVAPLEGFATETREEAEREIRSLLGSGRAKPRRGLPAFGAGVETALADLDARQQGRRLSEKWTEHPRERIPCHFLLRETKPDALAEEAADAVVQGFRTLKIKVGALTVEEDEDRLAAVRQRVGNDVSLRADANGAYDPTTALDALRRFEKFQLEFIEQPVPDGLATLRGKAGIGIAADESIGCPDDALKLISQRAVDVLILKPMAIGGLDRVVEIAGRASDAGIGVVVTSVLDSAVGIAAALHVAAALPVETTCGLATLDHLEATPIYGLQRPVNGSLALPPGPGLGVEIDPKLLGGARG